ncbi:MAG: hypothetical protein ABS882_13940 [Lysinibacillus sp.]
MNLCSEIKFVSKFLSNKDLLTTTAEIDVKKYSKNYIIQFFTGGAIFKVIAKKKPANADNARLFSFDYHTLDGFYRKKKAKTYYWHYHINYTDVHYVLRSNWQYKSGHYFTKTNYQWVW